MGQPIRHSGQHVSKLVSRSSRNPGAYPLAKNLKLHVISDVDPILFQTTHVLDY